MYQPVYDRVAAVAARDEGPRKLFLHSLPQELSAAAVHAALASYGELESCSVVEDKLTGRGKGFGFALFADMDDAAAVVELARNGALAVQVRARTRASHGRRLCTATASYLRLSRTPPPTSPLAGPAYQGALCERPLDRRGGAGGGRRGRRRRWRSFISSAAVGTGSRSSSSSSGAVCGGAAAGARRRGHRRGQGAAQVLPALAALLR